MVAGEEDGPEVPGIQPGHHGERVPGPAPEDAGLGRKLGGIDVPGGVVGVLQKDALRPGGQGPLAGGADLPGHLRLEGAVVLGGGALGLRPVGDAAGPLDIGADIDLHCCTLLFLSDGAVSPRYFPF